MIEQRLAGRFRTANPNTGNCVWTNPYQHRYLQAQRQAAAVMFASGALAGLILTLGVLPGL